jgi:outer membrane receptor protein involved in Fe transport
MMNAKNFLRNALITSVAIVAAAAPAQAQTQSFDIPAGDLKRALDQFSRVTEMQLLFRPSQVRGARTRGVRGTMSAEAALQRILASSGFRPERDPSGALAIVRETSGSGNGAQSAEPTSSLDDASDQIDEGENSEIVVTGTNIRGANPTVPTATFSRADLQASGKSTTANFIETLPQNYALANQSTVSGDGVSGGLEQGAAINLRGVGEGTTLVLLNGRRQSPGYIGSAVDISALPISLIERVEIVTDGASAIYGADAVGGVVNFILRDDFEGLESSARYGVARGGFDEFRVNQLAGTRWSTGRVLAAFDYYDRDLLRSTDRDFVPDNPLIGSLLPRDKTYSAMLSGKQDLSDRVTLFADGLYTNRKSFNLGGITLGNVSNISKTQQSNITGGASWDISDAWRIEAALTWSQNHLVGRQNNDFYGAAGAFLYDFEFETTSTQVKADGPLFDLPGGPVRAAIGGEWRHERFTNAQGNENFPIAPATHSSQDIKSAFAELNIPVFGPANETPGLYRLTLSASGRVDDYSRFGSAFNPMFGVRWQPSRWVSLRASYGTSYRAPKLIDYSTANNYALAYYLPEPSAPSGLIHVLELGGTDVASLGPERSKNLSFGVEFADPSGQGLKIGANFYSLRFRGQITAPPYITVVLSDPTTFAPLIQSDPSLAAVQSAVDAGNLGQGLFAYNPDLSIDNNFDPSSIDFIVEQRRRNLASVHTSGLDVYGSYSFRIGSARAELGANGTYVFKRSQKIASTSPSFETIGTFFNPPKLRIRTSASITSGGLAANVFGNLTGSYRDNRALPEVRVKRLITVDARISYSWGEGEGILNGLSVALNASNLFDADPPRTRLIDEFRDLGFDPTNANPLGRLVTFEVTKRW